MPRHQDKVEYRPLTEAEVQETWSTRTAPFVRVVHRLRTPFHVIPAVAATWDKVANRGRDGSQLTGTVQCVLSGFFHIKKATMIVFNVKYDPSQHAKNQPYDLFLYFLRSVPPGTPLTPLPPALWEMYSGLSPGPGGTIRKPPLREPPPGTGRNHRLRPVRALLSKLRKEKEIVRHLDHPGIAMVAPYWVKGPAEGSVEHHHNGLVTITENSGNPRFTCATKRTSTDDALLANGIRATLHGGRGPNMPPIYNYTFAVVAIGHFDEFKVLMKAEQYFGRHYGVRRAVLSTNDRPWIFRWDSCTQNTEDLGLRPQFEQWTDEDFAKVVDLPENTETAEMIWKNPGLDRRNPFNEEGEQEAQSEDLETTARASPGRTPMASSAQ